MSGAAVAAAVLAVLALSAGRAALLAGAPRLPAPGASRTLVGAGGLGDRLLAWGRGRLRTGVAAQLPPLLEAVASRLRAGGSLSQALLDASPQANRELAVQWRRMTELVPAVGTVAALQDWADRSEDSSVRLVAAALAVAAGTGGSPARAVDGVAATLRARIAVADELRALSSQARASAVVIAVAPLFFGLLAGITDPRTTAFLGSPSGITLVLAGLALDALGGWWMLRLCRMPSA